jgi:hypothetical protein
VQGPSLILDSSMQFLVFDVPQVVINGVIKSKIENKKYLECFKMYSDFD